MLKLEGVVAGYGATMVLQNFALNVDEGEMVAVLGRNGVGKTTMLRATLGAIPLTSGAVYFKGENISALPTYERSRRGIAYVPQGREIFPSLTVQENLLVAAYGTKRSDDKARLDAMLREFPVLAEKRHDRGSSLSGGQQQILALGRALMTAPRMLLLDEPSEGIQPSIVNQIAEIVRKIHKEQGITVILVEQNLDFAASIAPRACVVDKGEVVRDLLSKDILVDRVFQREFLGL